MYEVNVPLHIAIMHTKNSIMMKIPAIVTPRLANHLNEGSIWDVAPDSNYIVPQSHKRTFWAACTIDKHLTVVSGCP